MGGRDYPADFVPDRDDPERQHGVAGVSEWDDLPGWAQRELAKHGIFSAPTDPPEVVPEDDEEYRRGYDDGWDAGRVAAMNQGFSDAWDGGWKACQKWFVNEQRLRSHKRAGLMRGGYCGKTGIDNPGDCSCLDFDFVAVKWPDPVPQEGQEEVAQAHGLENLPGWGKRDWAREAMLEHQGRTADGPLDEAVPEVCEENKCKPVRLPGGWWCQGCDKPLRLVRPLYRPDREDADG